MDRFETFSLALFSISRCWNKIAGDEMKRFGLKGAHAFYLVTILSHDGVLTAANLCELCGRDKAEVSRGIAAMEKLSLLERTGGNSYRARLKLTDAGLAAARSIQHTAASIVDYVGKDLTSENREVLYQSLAQISDNLEHFCREGSSSCL